MGERRIVGAAVAVVLAGLAAPPALGFDQLERAVAQLPESIFDAGGGWMFDFAAPETAFELGIGSVGIGRVQLSKAILDPGPALQLTGIDFSRLDGIMVFGEMPADIVYMSGSRIDQAAIAAALERRGFEAAERAGVTVFAKGDDLKTDPPNADEFDPFGAAVSRSQRIAVGDHVVMVAPAWTSIEPLLPFHAEAASPATDVLTQMVAAARRSARPMTTAYYASALTIAAFASSRDVRDGLQSFAVEALREPTMPLFTVALIVAAGSRDHETAELVLAYPDRATAEEGIAEVARRLEAAHDEPMMKAQFRHNVHDAIIDGQPFAIGVASVMFPVAPAGAARFEANRWAEDIYLKQFEVLKLFD